MTKPDERVAAMSGRWLQVSFHAWLPEGTELRQPAGPRFVEAMQEMFGFTATDSLMVEAATPAAAWTDPVGDLDHLLDAVWRGEDRVIVMPPDVARYGTCELGHPLSLRMQAKAGDASFGPWCATCDPDDKT